MHKPPLKPLNSTHPGEGIQTVASIFRFLEDRPLEKHLNHKEFAILEALLCRKQGFPSTLSRLSQINRSDVYALCKNLSEKGWLIQKEQHGKAYYNLKDYKEKMGATIEELNQILLDLHRSIEIYEEDATPKTLEYSHIQDKKAHILHRLIDEKIPSQVSILCFEHEEIKRVFIRSISDKPTGEWIKTKYQGKIYGLSSPSDYPINKTGIGIQTGEIQYDSKFSAFSSQTIKDEIANEIQKKASATAIYFIPFSKQDSTHKSGAIFLFKNKLSAKKLAEYEAIMDDFSSLFNDKSPLRPL